MTTDMLRVVAALYALGVFAWAWQAPVTWSVTPEAAVVGGNAAKGLAFRSLSEDVATRSCSCQGWLTFHKGLSRSARDHADCGASAAAVFPSFQQQQQHTHLRRLSSNITQLEHTAQRRRWKHVLLRARTRSKNTGLAELPSAPLGNPSFSKESPQAMQPPQVHQDAGQPAEPGLIGVYTGWLAQNNLGDELVADIFLDLLTAAVIEATDEGTCVTLDRASSGLASSGWRGCTLANNSACDFGVMGGGSTISVDYIRRIDGILAAKKQVLLFGSGQQSGLHQTAADMDKYLTMFCQRKLLGGVRGPYTQAHLYKFGCSRGSIPIIRDSGLIARLLYQGQGLELGGEPGSSRSRLQQQLQEHADAQRHVIAVTLKEEFLPILNDTLLALLASGKYAVVLQAVDNQTVLLHQSYQQRLNQGLPPGAAPVMINQEFQDWAAVLDLYSRSSASLNSRLHSGVLSASALRPTLFVANNTKFRDFCTSLGPAQSSRRGERGRVVLESSVGHARYNLVDNIERAINRSSITHRALDRLQRDTFLKYKAVMAAFMSELEKQDPARYRATLCCKHIHIVRSAAQDKRVLVKVQCLQAPGPGKQLPAVGSRQLSAPP